MRTPARLAAAAALALAMLPAAVADEGDAGVVRLFNGKDLSGWSLFIRHADKDADPRADPKGIFRVEDGLIHVSGEEFGCLTTDREFEDYRLVVEFRWGTKKWPPREDAVRDSGILMHATGPDKVWTKSIECQIQEGDTGDFWMVDGTTLVVDGEVQTRYKKKAKDAEKPTGEWNTVEVVCKGGRIINVVNGVVVNEGTDASVTRGRIVLQSEGAEVFFRKVELHPVRGD